MNKMTLATGRVYCAAIYSAVSGVVSLGLIALAVYWLVLQPAPLAVDTDGLELRYSVTRGTIVYLENPITPPMSSIPIELHGELVGIDNQQSYKLSTRDSRDMILLDEETRPPYIRLGFPLYGVYVPQYVKPGLYRYEVEATYPLNFFRRASLDLPPLTITVE